MNHHFHLTITTFISSSPPRPSLLSYRHLTATTITSSPLPPQQQLQLTPPPLLSLSFHHHHDHLTTTTVTVTSSLPWPPHHHLFFNYHLTTISFIIIATPQPSPSLLSHDHFLHHYCNVITIVTTTITFSFIITDEKYLHVKYFI